MTTNRLFLRAVEKSDLEFLMHLRNDPQVSKYILPDHLTMKKQLVWFKGLGEKHRAFVICLRDGTRIGTIGVKEINKDHKRAKWYVRIHPDHWRMGYAKEAMKIILEYVFEELNLNKLMGDCFVEHVNEVENLLKLGFKSEGIWKQHYFHNGHWMDSVQLAMLKEDYEIWKHSY